MSENIKDLAGIYEKISNTEINSFDLSSFIDMARRGDDLSCEQAITAMRILMSGQASDTQMRDLLISLHEKGETVEEIASFAFTMREYADSVEQAEQNRNSFADTCGTGGKAAEGQTIETFNVSTAVAFVLAAYGVKVAKHGNRGITSGCGSCDVLERLGVKVDISLVDIYECINATGIGFIFAPKVHSATRFVQPIRKTIFHPTIFNILGPLSNPFYPVFQLMGVYDAALTEKAAAAFHLLGIKKALVVHGFSSDRTAGMDEFSLCGPTKVSELKESGKVNTYYISPEDLGFNAVLPEQVKGGTPEENASLLKDIFSGREKGPRTDLLILNAAGGLTACGAAADIKEGIVIARDIIESGKASVKIDELVRFTNNA